MTSLALCGKHVGYLSVLKLICFICTLGTYENQFYVQQSLRLREEVHDRLVAATANNAVAKMPRIRWHPYIATGQFSFSEVLVVHSQI